MHAAIHHYHQAYAHILFVTIYSNLDESFPSLANDMSIQGGLLK